MNQQRPTSDFLDPSNFTTHFDHQPAYAKAQYEKGHQLGLTSDKITIAVNDCWSAESDHVYTHSYERIGHHAHTADLYRGMLDGCAESDCIIIITRASPTGHITRTTLQGYEYCLECGAIVVALEDHHCPDCHFPTERFTSGTNGSICLGSDCYQTDHYYPYA